MTWITDANNNRCSVEKWGSEEKAKEILATLVACSNCSDCVNCFDCSRCSSCFDCSRCSRCSNCSNCSDCSSCSRCSNCSDCSSCFDCSDCSNCSDCSSCFDCSDCSNCFNCFNCSDCSNYFNGIKTNQSTDIPVIENLHQMVYAAVLRPGALYMNSWHHCETTHCRAGWVVHLTGEKGKTLEARFGTLLAAMKIYDASCPGFKINPCRFFDSNEDALDDMRKLADEAISGGVETPE